MTPKKYPNLHRVKWTTNWVFRKYSSAKRAEFTASTGIPATDANAAKAYKAGMDKFDRWLGIHLEHGRNPLIRDLARTVLASKNGRGKATQLKARTEIENHILPAFGHFRPDQITAAMLRDYELEERAKGKRKSFFNTRKYLLEILRRAEERGCIKALPAWKPLDPEAEEPRFIDTATFRRIRRLVDGPEKLALFIMYHQGARPREVLRYRWEMIRWGDVPSIEIPGSITKTKRKRTIPLNSRVARALRGMRRGSGPIFPNRLDPNESRAVYDRGWNEAMEKLGLDFIPYNLRDTFITSRLRDGVSTIYIARYVDSSAEQIEKRYAVPLPDIMRRIAR